MKKTKTESLEIMSFNDQIPELPSLIELDELALEGVVGGVADCGTNCGTNCGSNGVIIIIVEN